MNAFDQFVKHNLRVKYYIRYTDDFIIVSENEKVLHDLIGPTRGFLGTHLRLSLHPKKIEIRKFGQGVDFLGYVLFPHYRRLRTKTKRRIKRKLIQRIDEYNKSLIGKSSIEQSLQSYLGVLSHANTHRLEQELLNTYWFLLTSNGSE